mgnify:CR=1 FL=1
MCFSCVSIVDSARKAVSISGTDDPLSLACPSCGELNFEVSTMMQCTSADNVTLGLAQVIARHFFQFSSSRGLVDKLTNFQPSKTEMLRMS